MIADDAVVRISWDDALERDGQVLALCGNEVTLMSELASAAVLFCGERGATIAAVVDHLEATFGAPEHGDSGAAVRELLVSLQERGVVSIGDSKAPGTM